MIEIKLSDYSEFKANISTKGLKHFSYVKDKRIRLIAIDGPLYYTHHLAPKNEKDYEENLKASANGKIGDEVVIAPFASKGKNHFRGKGVKLLCPKGEATNIDYAIPAGTFRFNGIEVLNGDYGDEVQLQIVDTVAGSYSGVPSYVLDQFGDTWNMSKELKKVLPYEATIYSGMIIRVKYTNNTENDKMVYVNHDLHLVA